MQALFKNIENETGKEIIVSYISRAKSRFKEEPITVYVEANYNGMKGIGKTVYYPGRWMRFIWGFIVFFNILLDFKLILS